MTNKNTTAYRTPADVPEPEWRELARFEVEVERLDIREGAYLVAWQSGTVSTFEHHLQTKNIEVKKLRLGQRVRVILQVMEDK